MLGAAVLTFGILMLVALVLGRWRKLGFQGPQVGVAALFAYSSFTQSGSSPTSFIQLASIAGLVVMGCALGVVTNLVIVPPMRYRSAEYGISALSRSLCDLLTDISDGLRAGVPDKDQADAWMHRADQFPETVSQARSAVEHAAETMRYNPRRLFLRSTSSFEGHRAIVNALERASEQLRSTSRGLTYAAGTDHPARQEHEDFLAAHASVLAGAANVARIVGELHSAEDTQKFEELEQATESAERAYTELAEQAEGRELDSPDQWPIYGALQTDAHRIVEEFIQCRRDLSRLLSASEDEQKQVSQGGRE